MCGRFASYKQALQRVAVAQEELADLTVPNEPGLQKQYDNHEILRPKQKTGSRCGSGRVILRLCLRGNQAEDQEAEQVDDELESPRRRTSTTVRQECDT